MPQIVDDFLKRCSHFLFVIGVSGVVLIVVVGDGLGAVTRVAVLVIVAMPAPLRDRRAAAG